MKQKIFEENLTIATTGLLGFAVKKLAPSKKNMERFQKQFTGHPLCGCMSCMEIGKSFILNDQVMKEEIIAESTKDYSKLSSK